MSKLLLKRLGKVASLQQPPPWPNVHRWGIFLVLLTVTFGGLCVAPWELAWLLLHLARALWSTCLRILVRGFQPLYPQWTLAFELMHSVMRCCTEMYGHRIVLPFFAKYTRLQSEMYGNIAGIFSNGFHKIKQTSVLFNGQEHLWLRSICSRCHPLGGVCASPKRLVVLYLHGGGYCALSPRMYVPVCNSLAAAIKKELTEQFRLDHVRVEVFVANYRKVPEHRFPVPAQDAVAMYRYLVDHEKVCPQQIVIAGDSAGGGLVMSTLLRLRDASPQDLPLAGVVSCPFVDLSDPKRDAKESEHCVLSRSMIEVSLQKYHATLHDPTTWQDASAVHCDLRGLPPVFIQAAELDQLFHHALKLAKKAEADGVIDWELDVHTNMPHVFFVFPSLVLPYASVGIQRMADFAARHFAGRKAEPTAPKAACMA